MSTKSKTKETLREGFIRKTVTLPSELESFIETQAGRPEHAGNLSAYIRNLILRDRAALPDRKQAA